MTVLSLIFVTCSALIDIIANIMIEKSDGFKRLSYGFIAIILVWIAFALLGQAVKTMDLAIAYAMWGAIGVIGTAISGRIFFNHRLKPIGWLGIILVCIAVILLSIG